MKRDGEIAESCLIILPHIIQTRWKYLGRHERAHIDQCCGCVVSCRTNWEVLERDSDLYAWSLFADRNQASGKVRQLELDHFKFQSIYAFDWCSYDITSLGRRKVTSETLCSLCTNLSEMSLSSKQICCSVTLSKQF
jgi:hypothetical protein